MTDREALVRAICADPADDTPRLVYADWLEENGEPERAEFIRVQVRLAAMKPFGRSFGRGKVARRRANKFCDELNALRQREALTLPSTAAERVADFRHSVLPVNSTAWRYLYFRRGFGWVVVCTAEDWLRVADDVFWSPAQTVPCGRCDIHVWDLDHPEECPHCRGDRVVPRPFPAGAGRTAVCPVCRDWDDDTYARNTAAGVHLGCSGRVPAPAALPHPIEEVQLTTTDWLAWAIDANTLPTFGGNGTFTDLRWPDILFHTPGGHRPA